MNIFEAIEHIDGHTVLETSDQVAAALILTELKAYLDKSIMPTIPVGYALVPIEPTDRMRHAFWRAHERYKGGSGEMPDSGWRFMLHAASTQDVDDISVVDMSREAF